MNALIRKIYFLLRNCFAVFGVVCFLVASLYGLKIYRSSSLPPRQFAIKALAKLGVSSSAVEKALTPAPRYDDVPFQGSFKNSQYPRLVFGKSNFRAELRARYRTDPAYKRQVDAVGKGSSPLNKAIAWTCSGDKYYQAAGISALKSTDISTPRDQDGREGNGWMLAMTYDLLRDSSEKVIPDFEIRLQNYVSKVLAFLDEDSTSLWHARFTLASSAWVAASVLDHNKTSQGLIRQAQTHYLQALLALEVSEGWPEGYTYWINNRAFIYVLAGLAHMHTVDEPGINTRIRKSIERVGLWTIHATEPIARINLSGDTGPRNDLKYDTQRVIDLIFMATDNPIFKHYSEYLSTLFTTGTYDRSHRWGLPLLQGVTRKNGYTKRPDMSFLDGVLPTADLFGGDALGQAFIRSGWGDRATFVAFESGKSMAHHNHYQAGHFSIYKNEPLAIKSGTYGEYFSPHRLNYYLRTVASNSLLILKPDEKVRPNKFFDVNVADGGQRVVMPTGSAITSVEDWRDNLHKGRHYEGGEIVAFVNRDDLFTYVSSDLTGAYNNTEYDENGKGGKVSRVTRELLYLRPENTLIVHDRVNATSGDYTKKWLLHSFEKPQSLNEYVLSGRAENGILETADASLIIPGNKSSLLLQKLLPEDGVIRKVGGPDFRYYVEVDGDDFDLDGMNMDLGAKEKPWFDSGMWRLEIQPETGRKEDRFLVLLKPGSVDQKLSEPGRLLNTMGGDGVETAASVVLFVDSSSKSKVSYHVTAGDKKHLLLGVSANKSFQVEAASQRVTVHSSAEGVVVFDLVLAKNADVRVEAL